MEKSITYFEKEGEIYSVELFCVVKQRLVDGVVFSFFVIVTD